MLPLGIMSGEAHSLRVGPPGGRIEVKPKLKWLVIVLLLLGALEGLYVVAGNWALRSGFAARLVSRKPERFLVEWASGRTVWPGVFKFEGIRVRGQSERLQSYLTVDRCSLRVNLSLLVGCRVQMEDVKADGVSLRVRHRREPGAPRPSDRFEPPIPGLEQDAPPPPRKPYPSPWIIAFGSTKVEDIRELWVGPYRVTGGGQAEGDARYRLRGPLRVKGASFKLEGATITMGDELIASDLKADVTARVDSVVVREHRGRPFLRYVSGRLKAVGEVTSLGFLNELMGENAPLTFRGRGNLDADVTFDRGLLGPESSVAWEGDILTASSAGYSVGGKGNISGGTGKDDDRSVSILARWSGITLTRPSRPPVTLEGSGLTATLSGKQLDLASDTADLRVALDLPDGRIDDVSVVSEFLPPRMPFTVLSGSSLQVRSHWELQGSSATGAVSLEGPNVGLGLGKQALRGPFYAEVKVGEGDIPNRRFDISGSRFGFKNAAFLSPNATAKGDLWTGEATVTRGTVVSTDSPTVKASLALTMTDTRPVVAIFASSHPSVKWFKGVLAIKGIKGSANLSREGSTTAIDGVDIQGQGLMVLARIRLRSGVMDGAFFTQLHGLSAAIHLKDGKSEWRILGARKWYDTLPQ
jgi:hypothetical protein